ncbi:MAG: alpha/beta hydrolase [Lachnospiraceae bacterium]|nr:alpha/beta hydrolase [Lachnospiraceae bacterium]
MRTEVIDIKVEGSQPYAALTTYILDHYDEIGIGKRPLVLVCPGGAYAYTSRREAEIIALQFTAMGYHAAVLNYSVAPAVFPTANLELGKSIAFLKSKAEEWYIDADKIVPLGFSAGGHMVASYCLFWNKENYGEKLGVSGEAIRPGAMMLGYPVITSGEYAHRGSIENILGEKKDDPEMLAKMSLEDQVSSDAPRTFMWHTFEDGSVPVMNSVMLMEALVKAGVPVEYHVFEKGGHGLGLANRLTQTADGGALEPTCECWIELAHRWMENL